METEETLKNQKLSFKVEAVLWKIKSQLEEKTLNELNLPEETILNSSGLIIEEIK